MTTVSDPTVQKMHLRRSMLDRAVAMDLAAAEYERFALITADLSADDWVKPTDLPCLGRPATRKSRARHGRVGRRRNRR